MARLRLRSLLATAIGILCTALVACGHVADESMPEVLALEVPKVGLGGSGTAVLPLGDTYVRSDAANKNYGSNDSLRLQKVGGSGANRVLLHISSAETKQLLPVRASCPQPWSLPSDGTGITGAGQVAT